MKTFFQIFSKILGIILLGSILGFIVAYSTTSSNGSKSFAAYDEINSAKNYDAQLLPQTQIVYTKYIEPVKPRDERAVKLEKYLKSQKTILANYADLIINLSDKYKVDYKIVISIAGLESGYCKITFKKNNCWGFGTYSWSTMDSALENYFRLMYVNYFRKGLNTIEKIAPIYNSENTSSFLSSYKLHYSMIADL